MCGRKRNRVDPSNIRVLQCLLHCCNTNPPLGRSRVPNLLNDGLIMHGCHSLTVSLEAQRQMQEQSACSELSWNPLNMTSSLKHTNPKYIWTAFKKLPVFCLSKVWCLFIVWFVCASWLFQTLLHKWMETHYSVDVQDNEVWVFPIYQ